METAHETAQRVVNRLLGEETTTPAPKSKPAERPRFETHRPAPLRAPLHDAKAGKSVPKAFKQGKKSSGKAVGGKPGKVSYREALMQSVLEKLKQKKAAKGTPVAKAPGSVSYKKESTVLEKMGSGMKGAKAKKMLNTVAKKPGKVSFGKK